MKTHPKAKSPPINAAEVAWLLPVAVLNPFGSSPGIPRVDRATSPPSGGNCGQWSHGTLYPTRSPQCVAPGDRQGIETSNWLVNSKTARLDLRRGTFPVPVPGQLLLAARVNRKPDFAEILAGELQPCTARGRIAFRRSRNIHRCCQGLQQELALASHQTSGTYLTGVHVRKSDSVEAFPLTG